MSGLIFLGSPPEPLDGGAHGGEVDDARHAGEVLENGACRHEGDFDSRLGGFRGPSGEFFDIFLHNGEPVAPSEYGFEKDSDGERQFGEPGESGIL